jgi:hypothetical protein
MKFSCVIQDEMPNGLNTMGGRPWLPAWHPLDDGTQSACGRLTAGMVDQVRDFLTPKIGIVRWC